jgi:hypothetical protein
MQERGMEDDGVESVVLLSLHGDGGALPAQEN